MMSPKKFSLITLLPYYLITLLPYYFIYWCVNKVIRLDFFYIFATKVVQ
jgi:hypothetical protein